MTLTEAIRIKELGKDELYRIHLDEIDEADRLVIEAAKWRLRQEVAIRPGKYKLLPGETEE